MPIWLPMLLGGLALALTLYRVSVDNAARRARFDAAIHQYDADYAEMKARWRREDEQRKATP